MISPFVGQISIFAFNFVPLQHAFCHGQLIPISQNTPLFSLLGTTFGGDGRTTFAVPNLQGRVPIGVGQGQGLSPYFLGQESGSEKVTVTAATLPQHSHTFDPASLKGTLQCRNEAGNQQGPAGNVPAVESTGVTAAFTDAAPLAASMASDAVTLTGGLTLTPSGGGLPHNNMQPYLTLNYCIALQGVFPARP
jgi:microcystin-dependent protein